MTEWEPASGHSQLSAPTAPEAAILARAQRLWPWGTEEPAVHAPRLSGRWGGDLQLVRTEGWTWGPVLTRQE